MPTGLPALTARCLGFALFCDERGRSTSAKPATATTAAEWHDVAVEAAAVSVATRSERASAAYGAAVLMEHGDTALAAVNCAVAMEHADVEAWRTHTRWVIADERNVLL